MTEHPTSQPAAGPRPDEPTKGGSMSASGEGGIRSVPKGRVLEVDLSLLDYDGATHEVLRLTQAAGPSAVSFCNTHLVTEASRDPAFQKVLAGFDLNLPDGMPLIWLLNRAGAQLHDRVYGPYFMRRFFANPGSSRPLRHFLFGSTPDILGKLENSLPTTTAQIVGTLSPPFRAFTETDNTEFAAAINRTHPDCIWVALGGVRQERWIHENRNRFPRGVFLAVGDAFSLLAGKTDFAPAWMQRIGLTWLYRLAKDPVRLLGRYLRYNTLFLGHLLLQQISRESATRGTRD